VLVIARLLLGEAALGQEVIGKERAVVIRGPSKSREEKEGICAGVVPTYS
jgi:hypothetical protein